MGQHPVHSWCLISVCQTQLRQCWKETDPHTGLSASYTPQWAAPLSACPSTQRVLGAESVRPLHGVQGLAPAVAPSRQYHRGSGWSLSDGGDRSMETPWAHGDSCGGTIHPALTLAPVLVAHTVATEVSAVGVGQLVGFGGARCGPSLALRVSARILSIVHPVSPPE